MPPTINSGPVQWHAPLPRLDPHVSSGLLRLAAEQLEIAAGRAWRDRPEEAEQHLEVVKRLRGRIGDEL
jgi:hypothetical protein